MSFQPKVFLHKQRAALHSRFVSGWKSQALFEFITFGIKQAWACLFGGLMLALLLGTFLFYPAEAALSRYDFITLAAIAIQALMLTLKLESWEEARVIFVFHIVGTVMEIFKVHMGSWLYPEASILNIAGVPLFSGFMYACVGSYLARVWRIFDFKFDRFPNLKWQGLLAVLIYMNFFTHHFGPDIRIALFIGTAILYGPAMVWFRADEDHRPMPLLIGLVLVALFIWFAENLGTFAKAWTYPNQNAGWQMVSFAKLGSWYLLMIISFVLVAAVQGAHGKGIDLSVTKVKTDFEKGE
ncbi:DUF817 domain-containing protein [Litorimonas haliclonae]|uniref:DUF817 domain-containing protein n=1 Tax=Litorimonas haliclonae TaxID=2081977 RepID=UPI0039F0F23A